MSIEHIAIWVTDIENIREFYMKYFKVTSSEKYVNFKKGYTSYFLSFEDGKSRIELMNIAEILPAPIDREKMRGLAHIAISVGGEEAVNTLTENLRQDGYLVMSNPRITGDGYYESVISDPEGNVIEVCS